MSTETLRALLERLTEVETDLAERDATIERMRDILDRTAAAVRGPPPAEGLWGLADLPDLVGEARAEIAAYQLRPEGALPGWEARSLPPSGEWRLAVEGVRLYIWAHTHPVPWMAVHSPAMDMATGAADTPRAAMRAAEAEARRRGWLGGDDAR